MIFRIIVSSSNETSKQDFKALEILVRASILKTNFFKFQLKKHEHGDFTCRFC